MKAKISSLQEPTENHVNILKSSHEVPQQKSPADTKPQDTGAETEK